MKSKKISKAQALELLHEMMYSGRGIVSGRKLSLVELQLIRYSYEALEQQPCKDCVKREPIQKAIKDMQYWINSENRGNADYFIVDKIEEIIAELNIDNLIPVTPNAGWIPISERLPNHDEYMKNNGLFIVSDGNRNYCEWYDIYDEQKFGNLTINGFRIDKCVIAWMPLPLKPYKEESEEEV